MAHNVESLISSAKPADCDERRASEPVTHIECHDCNIPSGDKLIYPHQRPCVFWDQYFFHEEHARVVCSRTGRSESYKYDAISAVYVAMARVWYTDELWLSYRRKNGHSEKKRQRRIWLHETGCRGDRFSFQIRRHGYVGWLVGWLEGREQLGLGEQAMNMTH
jgi:hypothetical protein